MYLPVLTAGEHEQGEGPNWDKRGETPLNGRGEIKGATMWRTNNSSGSKSGEKKDEKEKEPKAPGRQRMESLEGRRPGDHALLLKPASKENCDLSNLSFGRRLRRT